METWRRNLWILSFGTLIASAGYSMVVPFLPLFIVQLGVHTNVATWSGVIFSTAFLAGAIVAPFWGAVADRYGRKPMLIRSGITLAVVYVLTAFVHNVAELLILRLIMGALSGYIPAAIALVGSTTPEESVGYAMAMISTASSTGGILGPLLGGVVSHWFGYGNSFLVAGIAVMIPTALAIFWVREPDFTPSVKKISVVGDISIASRNRPFRTLLLTNALTAFAIMTIEPLLPLYVMQLGIPLSDASLATGIVFSVLGVASIIFTPFWGRVGDRHGFRLLLYVGLLGGGIGTIAQVFFHNIYTFGAIRFVYGIFFCAVFPAINALTVKVTAPVYRGRAFGLSQSANQVGTLLGPLVGGYLGDALQIHFVFIVTGTLLLLAVLYVHRQRRDLMGEAPLEASFVTES